VRKSLDRRKFLTGAAALAAPLIIGRQASAAAADRSITVGIYTGQQGDIVRKQIIPPFEAKHRCKVYTTQGVTLEQIALMRATRNNPKYSVMFVDDVGVELAKREGLIEQLPRAEIPNMDRLLDRLNFYDGFGAGFAMSAAGLAYNTATGKPLLSYGELWDPKLKGRFLMETPKATQSIYLLIAAVSVETGKPYSETQYMIEQAWPKMAALEPNVLSIFENQTTVMRWRRGRPTSPASSTRKASTPTRSRARQSTCVTRGKAPLPGSTPSPSSRAGRSANSRSPSSTGCSIPKCSSCSPRRP
jgi:putative spermidine/putrescine transport system substrate-binding protein